MPKSASSDIPGMGAMTDTLEMVRNMWSGMKVPGMVMPTMSVDEINRQISDLKAVESWMTLNMNMLRSTIQALEVQSATIAALRSMGETVSAMVKPGGMGMGMGADGAARGAAGKGAAAKAPDAAPGGLAASPVTSTGRQEEATTRVKGTRGGEGAGGADAQFSFDPPTADKPPAPAAAAAQENAGKADAPQPAAPAGNPAAMAAPFANPAAWWNLLQDQFKQAVNSAVGDGAASGGEPSMPDSASSAKKNGSAAKSAKGGAKASAKSGKSGATKSGGSTARTKSAAKKAASTRRKS